jgi:DNA-binding transcriptional MerR regulator
VSFRYAVTALPCKSYRHILPGHCIMPDMRIGELAHKAAVSVQTIRFYERRKLLRDPQRSSSGYRNYDGGDLDNVTFIKWCQQLGFTLKEIRQLLQLHCAVAHSSDSGALRGSQDLLAS